jgi:hypothetical protein
MSENACARLYRRNRYRLAGGTNYRELTLNSAECVRGLYR